MPLDPEIRNLNNIIENKENFIKELTEEKTSLSLKVSELENRLKSQSSNLNDLLSEKQATIDNYEKKLTLAQEAIDKKEKTVSELQTKLDQQMQEVISDKNLLTENQKYKLENEFLTKNISSMQQSLIDKESELKLLKSKLETEQTEKISYKELYLNEQQENIKNKQAFDILNKKLNASFEPADMADYLTNAITDFNKQTNTSDSYANYIISDMDVELKTNIAKNDSNKMLLSSPSLATNSESAISTIKFSIRAVPKSETTG